MYSNKQVIDYYKKLKEKALNESLKNESIKNNVFSKVYKMKVLNEKRNIKH